MQATSLAKAIDRFKHNWTGYISEYRIWLIVTLIAAIVIHDYCGY